MNGSLGKDGLLVKQAEVAEEIFHLSLTNGKSPTPLTFCHALP
jgi:hypothetical protein